MKKGSLLWGALFIVLGVIFLLGRFFDFTIDFSVLWPLFVLALGLIFEASYFMSMKNPGLLVPGGILTTLGILFFFETITGWSFAGRTWPVYPLAVAIGLFQLYVFGGRERGLLIPVGILSAVSLISFITMILGEFASSLIFPIALILIGAYIVLKGLKR